MCAFKNKTFMPNFILYFFIILLCINTYAFTTCAKQYVQVESIDSICYKERFDAYKKIINKMSNQLKMLKKLSLFCIGSLKEKYELACKGQELQCNEQIELMEQLKLIELAILGLEEGINVHNGIAQDLEQSVAELLLQQEAYFKDLDVELAKLCNNIGS